MDILKDVVLKQALIDLRAKAIDEIEASSIDPKRVPLINPQVIINTIDDILGESTLAVIKLEHVEYAKTHQSGGNCYVDMLTLRDGSLLTLTEDSVCHWRSESDFYEDAGQIESYSELTLDHPTKVGD